MIDIKIRAYHFSLSIIRFFKDYNLDRRFYSLISQVIRSSCSVGANVVEGKNSSSKKELIRYYEIALKSANETKYWLCLLRDAFDKNKEELNILLKEADEISRIIAQSIISLKAKK